MIIMLKIIAVSAINLKISGVIKALIFKLFAFPKEMGVFIYFIYALRLIMSAMFCVNTMASVVSVRQNLIFLFVIHNRILKPYEG